MTDPETKFSKSIGWTLGERTGRYALIIDHGKVTYAEKEEKGSDVSVCSIHTSKRDSYLLLLPTKLERQWSNDIGEHQVSGAEAVLSKL